MQPLPSLRGPINTNHEIHLQLLNKSGDATTNRTQAFTASEGYFYNVHYLSKVTDGGVAGTYQNAAEITVGTQSTGTTTAEVTRHGGSGTGEGTVVGTFTIGKRLLGASANLDALTYRGGYTVTAPDGTVASGEFSVKAGKVWTSPEFPVGSNVELSESLSGLPTNLDWATPDFSQQEFVIKEGAAVDISLTNTATLRTQPFMAVKTLVGPAAATALVPTGTDYVIKYSYPAGPGFPAGSGELTLEAGAPVLGPALPVGADVTIRERAPKALEGITWGTPSISPEHFTVAGETITVSVENPVAMKVTPPPTPSAAGAVLATTGMASATASVLVAVLLLGGGASLIILRRFHRFRR